MLIWEGNCKKPKVFWMMIYLLNFNHHVDKSYLLKITLKLLYLWLG